MKKAPIIRLKKEREKRTNIHEKRSMTQSLKTIRRKEGKQTKYLLITFFERGRLRIVRKKKPPRKVVLLL